MVVELVIWWPVVWTGHQPFSAEMLSWRYDSAEAFGSRCGGVGADAPTRIHAEADRS